MIKALTLHQPWASLMAQEIKTIETRSWSTDYRGLLAIHAGKKVNRNMANEAHRRGDLPGRDVVRGAVVCIVQLEAVRETRHLLNDQGVYLTEAENFYGDFSLGRYAWVTKMVYRIRSPIPAQGHQGLWWWDMPDSLLTILKWQASQKGKNKND